MRSKRTPGPSTRPATSKTKKCRTCDRPHPAGSLIAGECPDCAGLVALPLRGERGWFLPGITPTPRKASTSSTSSTSSNSSTSSSATGGVR